MEVRRFCIFSVLFLALFLALFLVSVNCFEKARYDNYRVYDVIIENQEQLDLLKHIDDYPDGVSIRT